MTATAPKPLYAIASDYEAIISTLEENGGELTPDLESALNLVTDDFATKVEAVALFHQNLRAMSEAALAESRRLSNLAIQRGNAADSLKDYLKAQLERVGQTKLETGRIKIRIQKNSQPSVAWVGDPAELPEYYRTAKLVYSVNRENVIDAHNDGKELPVGLTVERGTHLRIA